MHQACSRLHSRQRYQHSKRMRQRVLKMLAAAGVSSSVVLGVPWHRDWLQGNPAARAWVHHNPPAVVDTRSEEHKPVGAGCTADTSRLEVEDKADHTGADHTVAVVDTPGVGIPCCRTAVASCWGPGHMQAGEGSLVVGSLCCHSLAWDSLGVVLPCWLI